MKSSIVTVTLILVSAATLVAGCGHEKSVTKPEVKKADAVSSGLGFDEVLDEPKLSLTEAVGRYASVPSQPDYMAAANRALDEHDYLSAETLLNEVIRRDSNNGDAYYLRGRARFNAIAGAEEEALADMKKAVSLGAGGANAYKFMARIYDSIKQTEKAVEALDTAIELMPDQKDSYKYRAALCFTLGWNERAKHDYDKVVEFDPTDAAVHFLRGQLLESMNRVDEAFNDYGQVLKLESSRNKISMKEMAYKRRAAILSERGEHERAVRELTDAIPVEEDDDELLRLRGQQFMKMKEFGRAIADFNKSIELAPDFARSSLEARAAAYDQLGKKDLARKDRAQAKLLHDKPAEKPVYDAGSQK